MEMEKIGSDEAMEILYAAYGGTLLESLPLRCNASPIETSIPAFYVLEVRDFDTDVLPKSSSEARIYNHIKGLTEESRREQENAKLARFQGKETETTLISVKYQGYHMKNSNIEWSNKYQGFGVMSRAMSLAPRMTRAKSANDSLTPDSKRRRKHGFAGCQYTLVQNNTGKNLNKYCTLSNAEIKKLIVKRVPSLVAFWKHGSSQSPSLEPANFAEYNGVVSAIRNYQKLIAMPSPPPKPNVAHRVETYGQYFQGDTLTIKGDLYISGKAIFEGNLVVKGDVVVEGEIRGTLVTRPGEADYAEWFEFSNPEEGERMGPATLVQLNPFQRKITLCTNDASSGPLLIVSTSPSIAAGLPEGEDRTSLGAFCAFMGQVPLKVKGPVFNGDLLYPSGENDGFAVNKNYLEYLQYFRFKDEQAEKGYDDLQPIATAMESCGEGNHIIMTLVSWQQNLRHNSEKEKLKDMNDASWIMWTSRLLQLTEYSISLFFFWNPNAFNSYLMEKFFVLVETVFYYVTYVHVPNYINFVKRGDCMGFLAYRLLKLVWQTWVITWILRSHNQDLIPLLFVVSVNICSTLWSISNILLITSRWLAIYPDKAPDVVQVVFKYLARWTPGLGENLSVKSLF